MPHLEATNGGFDVGIIDIGGAGAALEIAGDRQALSQRNHRRMTAADLMQVYQREAEKQRLLVKKSDFTQTRLLFVVEALKDLLANDGFINLLRAEGLATMPRALEARVAGGDHA